MSQPLGDFVSEQDHDTVAAVFRRELFARLRRLLRARGVAHVKVIYYAFEGDRMMTVCATPDNGLHRRLWVPANIRSQLVGFFLSLTTQRYPGWAGGEDVGGVYDWNLISHTLDQRHTAPQLVHERIAIRGL